MSRLWQDQAFVLHQSPHRETSLWVTLLTENNGIVRAQAKGARRPKSPLGILKSLFQCLHISLKSHDEWNHLQQAESTTTAMWLKDESLWCGLYLNELLYRLLPPQEESLPIFLAYSTAIDGLSQNLDQAPILRTFERELLVSLGHEPPFFQLPHIPSARVTYHPERGFSACQAHDQGYNREHLMVLTQGYEGLSPEINRTAKALHRQALRYWLGDRPLQSAQFWKSNPIKFSTDT